MNEGRNCEATDPARSKSQVTGLCGKSNIVFNTAGKYRELSREGKDGGDLLAFRLRKVFSTKDISLENVWDARDQSPQEPDSSLSKYFYLKDQ